MKRIVMIFILFFVVVVGVLIVPQKEISYDYLRLHIRANSNSEIDQNVKYNIKDEMVGFLTPYLCNITSKNEAVNVIEKNKDLIKEKCHRILQNRGLNYTVNIKIKNEYFPTRTYANTTLESGDYDAVIIELGEAVGDNWWCVMYPPLCFVNKNENSNQIKYKSKIYEWFKKNF